jgi:putative ABC transport system ATP-binding protein
LADFSQRLGVVFNLRVEMASKRYTANVLNQFFSQLTPFFFLSIGGYLVITGDLTLGSLVAVLAAYKDMYAPWKDMIDYYQKAEDARVKYGQLTDYFAPSGLMDRSMLNTEAEGAQLDGAKLVASNVVVEADEGVKSVDGASVTLQLPTHAAIIGGGGSGREEFARLLARQVFPNAGRLQIGGQDLTALPDSIAGRRIGYVGPEAYLGTGTIRDALVYPLLHRPIGDAGYDAAMQTRRQQELKEAAFVGNSVHDVFADWVDYRAAGCDTRAELSARIIDVLRLVDMEREVYESGLRRTLDPAKQPELAAKFIAARKLFQERLKARQLTSLVECFDASVYNVNASVAENILFGTPVGAYFAIENLGENPYMLRLSADAHLTSEFLDRGRRLAATMADIFRDLPPGHEFFDRFSFIGAEDLPAFDIILRRIESQGMKCLDDAERRKLMTLPFKLVVTQHHLGLIDADLQTRLLAARKTFAANLPADLRGAVQFFDVDGYNAASSIFENVLFGKVAATKAGSAAQVGRLVSEVLDEMGLRAAVVEAGLEYEIGVGGARLSAAQRQKLALARCLLKRPDILILNDALSALDGAVQGAVFANIKAEMQGRTLILVESGGARAQELDHVLVMERGKIAEGSKTARPEAAPAPAAEDESARDHDNLNAVVAMLAQIPLFAAIDRSKLKLLAFTSEHVKYDADQIVFHQNEPGDKAYVVIEGAVDVVLETPAGAHVVANLGRNQVFGEMALLSNMPRTTTIRASTPLTLLAISQDVFLRLVEEHSEIATGVMRILTERLSTTLRDYSKLSAHYDPVTNLPTQRVFLESCRQARARQKRFGQATGLLIFDLAPLVSAVAPGDREREVAAVREAIQHLRPCMRGTDILAHLRGHRFAVVLTHFISDDDGKMVAGRIVRALAAAFNMQGSAGTVLSQGIEFRMAGLDDDDIERSLEKMQDENAPRFVMAA